MHLEKNNAILEMRGISKSFPGVHALDKVDLSVRRGEIHCLLGENGAGKSTLIKILAGAYQKDEGEIIINGKRVEHLNPHVSQQLGISVIYQELELVPNLTVAENILLGRTPEGLPGGFVSWKKTFEAAQRILDDLGVDIDPRARVRSLGVAQQQMTEIAKALSRDAEVIVMDEPTSALTEQEIPQLFNAMRRLKAQNRSVIYISHRLQELAEIGDVATILRDGTLVGTVPIAGTPIDRIITMMVGRELREKFPKETVEIGGEIMRVEGLRRDSVLHDISFTLHRGEILGVAGLVGSGRTEMARAIFGADPINAGTIAIEGQPVRISSPTDAIRAGIGLLTEDRKQQGLILIQSVENNITLPSLIRFSPNTFIQRGEEDKAATDLVKSLGIKTPALSQAVKYLSGGNQQKVVVAKWVCGRSKILIFDEPTRGIDVGAKVEVYQLMNELVRQGVGIIMISSELPEVLGMSDRIIVMREGRISGEFKGSEATQESLLACAIHSQQQVCDPREEKR
jgi:ribose transport system ATP-binding protein